MSCCCIHMFTDCYINNIAILFSHILEQTYCFSNSIKSAAKESLTKRSHPAATNSTLSVTIICERSNSGQCLSYSSPTALHIVVTEDYHQSVVVKVRSVCRYYWFVMIFNSHSLLKKKYARTENQYNIVIFILLKIVYYQNIL